MLQHLIDLGIRWLDRNKIKAVYLNRKDKLTTGYVSELYIDDKFVCYALDTFDLDIKRFYLAKDSIVVDEFDQPHHDGILVLEPTSQLFDRLASGIDVTIDSRHMAIEC